MPIKMVCVDLDGTLLGKNNRISERTKETIQTAYKKGVQVVITTGRIFINAAKIRDELKIQCPIISSNGGNVVDVDLKKDIFIGAFGKEKSFELVNMINKYNVIAHFYTKDRIITNNIRGLITALIYKLRNENNEYKIKVDKCLNKKDIENKVSHYSNQIVKCVIYSENKEKIKSITEEVRFNKSFEAYVSSKYSVEINLKDVSKGKAIEILSKHLNINREEILAAGDNNNDMAMIKYAGIGVAMKNAIESLKDEADYITDFNEKDGVAKAIEKFVL